ncbi:putative membrane protein YhiD involved in acid resistance [Sporosarcina luteola]|nr:putative membrane protein YhiD involved in acid resistance [Sporosarcina luteola]
MDKITFTDIFKSSFLEKTSSFSIIDSLIGLLAGFFIGLFIYWVYKKTFTGVIYSHSFNIALIVMTMATALIIMGISSNILLSLGMVGALSIVRFRTPIKDPMDIVYIFWAIVSGILCGAGFIPLAVLGSVLIGLVLMLFINRVKIENPYLLVVRYDKTAIETPIEQVVAQHTLKHTIKSKSIMPGGHEITYEVRIKQNDMNFVNTLSHIEGVESAIMLSYDGNFTA